MKNKKFTDLRSEKQSVEQKSIEDTKNKKLGGGTVTRVCVRRPVSLPAAGRPAVFAFRPL